MAWPLVLVPLDLSPTEDCRCLSYSCGTLTELRHQHMFARVVTAELSNLPAINQQAGCSQAFGNVQRPGAL
jgi:hypothetical protein